MTSTCTADNCIRNTIARNLCMMHYQRLAKIGLPPKPTVEQRFWAKVDKTSGCWLWTGAKIKGYGAFRLDGRTIYAHRYSYELVNPPIPDDLQIDHRCRNRACVNPFHLRLATNKQNAENKIGERGAGYNKRRRKWMAYVDHNGKRMYLGADFQTKQEALEAARLKRLELFSHNDADRDHSSAPGWQ